MSGTVHPLPFRRKSHTIRLGAYPYEEAMIRTAGWGQSGWPVLLQSVISMFDQPDYRDLTDRLAGR